MEERAGCGRFLQEIVRPSRVTTHATLAQLCFLMVSQATIAYCSVHVYIWYYYAWGNKLCKSIASDFSAIGHSKFKLAGI